MALGLDAIIMLIAGFAGSQPAISQDQSERLSQGVAEAERNWLHCVQAIRDANGLPPSSDVFGPRFEVKAYREQCKNQVEQTRAALLAVELSSGREPTRKSINRLMTEARHRIADALLPPNPYRSLQLQESTGVPIAAGDPPVPARTCKGSVEKGLDAYNSGDRDLAFCHWWPKALQGNAKAQNNVGLLYEFGGSSMVQQNDNRAAEWYLAAAKQGLPIAMRNLARVQQRMGYYGPADTWLQQAALTEAQQIENQRQLLQGLNSFGYSLGCALGGGCASQGAGQAGASAFSVGTSGASDSGRTTSSSSSTNAPDFGVGSAVSASNYSFCPDGTYVSGPSCRLAPDGTYVGGTPTLAPDGTYVAGSPQLAPNGRYLGGSGQYSLCPDGSYVAGTRCILTPNGTYVGSN